MKVSKIRKHGEFLQSRSHLQIIMHEKQLGHILTGLPELQHLGQIRSRLLSLGLTHHPWISVIKQNQHNTLQTIRWMAYPQDQTTASRSHIGPSQGTSCFLSIVQICNTKQQVVTY